MQQVDFPIEILVHDDCSTDGTADIIKEYAKKYPEVLFPIYEKENQYANGKAGEIDFFNYKRARGKYIAYCEGDDFWCDPFKLKKQVDFLEHNPSYSVCFHICQIFEWDTGKYRPVVEDFPGGIEDIDVTPELFLTSSIGQPLSMVFRRSSFSYEWQKHYTSYCDTMELYHLLRVGKGRFMKFLGGYYNLHAGGVSNDRLDLNRSIESCRDYLEMYNYTHDKLLINEIVRAYDWCCSICSRSSARHMFCRPLRNLALRQPKLYCVYIKHRLKRHIKTLFK